ncbi:hypothetical protein DLAC_09472 [Tieghemostelium lacteum]|uniref:Uncharacterized protein n=1 Tax=Tieghemostelium lacteum TaxID=361077 RepID=A0A151Z6E1_TIELA|nr:hypothetical protein DLAC_09472 [Tieghemostelium lacteum]|eukprot:KYQ89522.1 hypothetical protein DLAC_09472 [Tieghemostelium lacteum]
MSIINHREIVNPENREDIVITFDTRKFKGKENLFLNGNQLVEHLKKNCQLIQFLSTKDYHLNGKRGSYIAICYSAKKDLDKTIIFKFGNFRMVYKILTPRNLQALNASIQSKINHIKLLRIKNSNQNNNNNNNNIDYDRRQLLEFIHNDWQIETNNITKTHNNTHYIMTRASTNNEWNKSEIILSQMVNGLTCNHILYENLCHNLAFSIEIVSVMNFKVTDRAQQMKVLTKVKFGDVIFYNSPDRFSRRQSDFRILVNILSKVDCDLIFFNSPFPEIDGYLVKLNFFRQTLELVKKKETTELPGKHITFQWYLSSLDEYFPVYLSLSMEHGLYCQTLVCLGNLS